MGVGTDTDDAVQDACPSGVCTRDVPKAPDILLLIRRLGFDGASGRSV